MSGTSLAAAVAAAAATVAGVEEDSPGLLLL